MQQLISFIQNYKHLLFFIFLQTIALTLTVRNNNFHKSKVFSSAGIITGSLYEKVSNISDYFYLKERNETLVIENNSLKNQLIAISAINRPLQKNITNIDSINYQQQYIITSSKIIKNEYHKAFNYLLVNKGEKEGITKEMAVYNSKGIIGITEKTSNNYTRVQSVLNKNSRISARLKNGSNYFGPLIWNGKSYNKVQLTDIPRQANVKIGDTIITSGRSTIFPEGILVGHVLNINKNKEITVQLFNDMSNLRHVYIVKNLHKLELKTLENE